MRRLAFVLGLFLMFSGPLQAKRVCIEFLRAASEASGFSMEIPWRSLQLASEDLTATQRLMSRQLQNRRARLATLRDQLQLENDERDSEYQDNRSVWQRIKDSWAGRAPLFGNAQTLAMNSEASSVENNVERLDHARTSIARMEQAAKTMLETSPGGMRSRFKAMDYSVFEWLFFQLQEHVIRGDEVDGAQEVEAQRLPQRLVENIRKFTQYIAGETPRNPLIFAFNEAIQKDLDEDADDKVDEVLGRNVNTAYSAKIFAIANFYGVLPIAVAEAFKSMDDKAKEVLKDLEFRSSDGIYDPYVLYLTAIHYDLGESEDSILHRFRELDMEGHARMKESGSSSGIHDAAVARLTKLSLQYNLEPENIIADFVEIKKRYSESEEFPELDDHEVVHLLASAYRSKTPWTQVAAVFEDILRRVKELRGEQGLSMKAALSLARYNFTHSDQPDSGIDEAQDFLELLRSCEEGLGDGLSDMNLVRLMFLSKEFDIAIPQLVGVLKRMHNMSDGELDDLNLISSLRIALKARNLMREGYSFEDQDLWLVVQIPFTDMRSLDEWLYDQRRIQLRGQRRGGYRDSPASRSRYVYDDSDDWDMFSMTNPLNVYNMASGGGMDSNLFTPW